VTRSRASVVVALFAASLAALAVSLAARTALAQDLTYRTPPEVVAKILTAPRLPRGAPNVSPDGSRLVVPELPSLIPIAALAEPVEKLAGLEILPAMRASRTALKRAATGFTILSIAGGRPVRAQLPDSSRVMDAAWSNDGKSLSCAVMAPGGADLWIVDATTGAARKIEGVKLNHVLVRHLEWSADDRNLYCAVVPPGQIPPQPASRVPAGPQVRVGSGRAAPQRTARDVLRTADDQDRFTWYLMAQLARVAVASGSVDRLGVPVMMRDWRLAPDEKHFIVERFNEKLPLGFPYELFPGRVEVWNADGSFAARVGVVPLNDRSAISSVAPLGPREAGWAPDGQSLYYFSWADAPGGEPMKAVRDTTVAQPGTDRLMRVVTPFTGDPEVVATSTDMQFESWAPIGETRRLLLGSVYEPRRVERVEWLDRTKPAERHVLTLRSSERVYDDPGRPVLEHRVHQLVARSNAAGTIVYLAGEGFRKEGQRPFLDRCDLASGRVTRLFESDDTHLEPVVALLDDGAKRFLTTRESSHEPPNFWVRRSGEKNGTRLTSFDDPAPALTASQRIQFTFTRPDSVKLHAEAVLPADWKPGHPLPTIFWIYPNDYRSAAAAQENRSSPNRFPSQSTLNPEVLVTQGYCVVRPDIAVVGTNDRYVEEIQASARAAVDECVRRGFTDRDRVGVGGHSYGAFSTANMLAHTDLFKAGTASDGAYNRTLTPFTFQAEDRTLWQAPQTYLDMSPFMHADQIRAPLLIFHNLDDTNVGTNPIQSDRMFEALNGMGRTVTLVQYPYEDHIPVAKETVLDYWARAIEWFDRYVKNAGGGATTPGTKSRE
jgi:dipeptidyl aminopeptidase/acylaminoacyl peptidase